MHPIFNSARLITILYHRFYIDLCIDSTLNCASISKSICASISKSMPTLICTSISKSMPASICALISIVHRFRFVHRLLSRLLVFLFVDRFLNRFLNRFLARFSKYPLLISSLCSKSIFVHFGVP